MSIIMIHYDKQSKTVRLLDKESKQTKDISESALMSALKHKSISVENLDLDNEQLKGTNGSIDRYISNSLTVINTIKNQNETIGFELSDCKGNIKKLRYNDCLVVARQYGLTNAKLTSSNDKEFISSITGEHEYIDITEVKESKIEPELKGKLEQIKAKAIALGLEPNKAAYDILKGLDKNINKILRYNKGKESIAFKNCKVALKYPQYSGYVTDMSCLFSECNEKSLDLSLFDTSNVTDMNCMFMRCKAKSINLSSFKTSKVTNMLNMFYECEVQSLDLASFDTRNVTNTKNMFLLCKAQSLDLSSFNTSNVTNMNCMFYACEAQSIILSSFNTSNTTDMVKMFCDCKAKSLDLSTFNTSKVTDMNHMFSGCKAQYIDLSSFNTSKVTDMTAMFSNCEVQSLDLSSFDITNVTNMADMFCNCKAQSLDLSSFGTSKVRVSSCIFFNCSAQYIKCNSFFKQEALSNEDRFQIEEV